MSDLILRPSRNGKYALQLRSNDSCGPTEYHTIARVSENVACEIVRAGSPFWLFGEPEADCEEEQPVSGGGTSWMTGTDEKVRSAKYAAQYGKKMIICTACSGSGYYDHDGSAKCGCCDGTEKVRQN